MAASRCSPILFPFFLYFCPKHYIISSKSWLLAYTKCRATLHLDGKFGSKLYYFFLNRAECMGFVVFIVCCHFISLYYLPREGPLLLLQAVQKALSRLIFSFCKDNHFFWESILFLLFFFSFFAPMIVAFASMFVAFGPAFVAFAPTFVTFGPAFVAFAPMILLSYSSFECLSHTPYL